MNQTKKQTAFVVVVRTAEQITTYAALGTDSAAVHLQALDHFGACGVTVKPRAETAQ